MKFLKIPAAFLLSIAVLCACTQGEVGETPQTAALQQSSESTMDGIIWWDEPVKTEPPVTVGSAPLEEGGKLQPDPSVLTISGWSYKSDLDDEAFTNAAALSGLGTRFAMYGSSEVYLKIMAGGSDVDIYVVSAMSLAKIKEKGLCLPYNSHVIDGFNAECFDYISEICKDSSGNTVAMPIGNEVPLILYPTQAEEELNFTRDDISYMEDFHALVENYSGDRTSYASWDGPIYNYMTQYNNFICDFENKEADYDTELFKKIYSLFDGWNLNSYALSGTFPSPKGFLNPHSIGSPDVDRLTLDCEKSLFLVDTTDYSTLKWVNIPDPFVPEAPDFDINDWRAAHIPWISENVSKNICNPIFAMVNPYSEHFDESVRALEYIAENFYESVDKYLNGSPFLKKDVSSYPDSFMTDTQIFKDVYEIAANGCTASAPAILGSTDDFIDYQSGRLSLEAAIGVYSRQVDAYLNE